MSAIGDELRPWTVPAVEPERMKVLALLLADPNPIHFDVVAAERLGLGPRVVNQGPSSIAMLANLLRANWPDGRVVALDVRLTGSLFAGDDAVATGVVQTIEKAAAGERITCDVVLTTALDRVVVRGQATLERPVPEERG